MPKVVDHCETQLGPIDFWFVGGRDVAFACSAAELGRLRAGLDVRHCHAQAAPAPFAGFASQAPVRKTMRRDLTALLSATTVLPSLPRKSIMPEAVASPLVAWENFYVIIGSAAAALTGLMFVVIALISEAEPGTSSPGLGAFATPTVVHFCAALLVSAILSAPWHELFNAGLALGMCGAVGVIYSAIVVRRARRQTAYKPVLEDWLWHAVFPLIAYTALFLAAIPLRRSPEPALFVVAAATLLLLFIGIHNSWDAVAYVSIKRLERRSEKKN